MTCKDSPDGCHQYRLIEDESGCEHCHYAATIGIARCLYCGKTIGPTLIENVLNYAARLRRENDLLMIFEVMDNA